jgi:hypothetical protein
LSVRVSAQWWSWQQCALMRHPGGHTDVTVHIRANA